MTWLIKRIALSVIGASVCAAALIAAPFLATEASAAEYHVAPHGDDLNAGTAMAPFRSIQQAADLAEPGDTVIVHPGVYRELVRPRNSGTSGARITYKAAESGQAAIKGSNVYDNWVYEGGGVWSAALDTSQFEDGFNPYVHELARKPGRTLGQVFLDGVELNEADDSSSLEEAPFTWKASVDGLTMFVHFGNLNPNDRLVEITMRKQLFAPMDADYGGIHYITLDGFHFSHSATQFHSTYNESGGTEMRGAIDTLAGHDWIIENNTIADVKTTAVMLGIGSVDMFHELGGYTEDYFEQSYTALGRVGHHIVRHNVIERAGSNGITGRMSPFTEIYGNTIMEANYLRFPSTNMTGAVKIYDFFDAHIHGNYFLNNYDNTLWIDVNNNGARITRNVFVNEREPGTVWFELSHGPVLIDSNIFINHDMKITDAAGARIVHNLFYDSDAYMDEWRIRTRPVFLPNSAVTDGNPPVSTGIQNNKLYNNMFIKGSRAGSVDIPDESWSVDNDSNYNLFVQGAVPSRFDGDSITSAFDAEFAYSATRSGVSITFQMNNEPWNLAAPLITPAYIGLTPVTQQPIEVTVDEDYYSEPVSAAAPLPGPFAGLQPGANAFVLWDSAHGPYVSPDLHRLAVTSQHGGIRLDVAFFPYRTFYEASVVYSEDQIHVDWTTASEDSVVTVNGQAVSPSVNGTDVDLEVGLNEIDLAVTADNGLIKRYRLNITRLPEHAVLLYDDFDADSAGASPPQWTVSNSNLMTVSAYPGDTANQSFLIRNPASYSSNLRGTRSFTPVAGGSLTVEFRFKLNELGGNINMGYLADENGAFATSMFLDAGALKLRYYDGGSSYDLPGGSGLPMDRWHRVKYVADLGGGTYDIYLNDMLVPKVTGAALRNPVASVSRLVFQLNTDSSKPGSVYFDHIYVRDGDAYSSPNLTGLTLWAGSEPIALDRPFAAETTEYTATVSDAVYALHLVPAAGDSSAVIKVDGLIVDSGQSSPPLNLAFGWNTVTITVASPYREDFRYRLHVLRLPDSALLAESFDGAELGQAPPGWTVSNHTLITVSPSPDSNPNMRMDNPVANTSNVRATHTFNAVSQGMLTVDYKLHVTDIGGNMNLGYVADENGNYATSVFLHGDTGAIRYYNGSIAVELPGSLNLPLHSWHRLRYVLNLDAQTYDIYLNDMAVPRVSQASFRSGISEVDRILFQINQHNQADGAAHVDDVFIIWQP